MADVILINPSISENQRGNLSNIRPHLGLLTIAAPLVKNGYSIKILDQRIEVNWKNTLLKELKKEPFCIGITCMSGLQIKFALELSKFIKESSSVPIIWGGVHPTLEPESTIRNKFVDVVVVGEGDYTFLKVVRTIEQNRTFKKIRGIAFKDKNTFKITKRAKLVNLNKLPQIPFNILDLNLYKQNNTYFGLKSNIIIPLETSRGCSHKCSFCFQSKNPYKWRAQDVKRMLSDVRYVIEELGVRAITFNDDNFFVDCKRVDDFSKNLIKEKLDIEWYTSIRPEFVKKIISIERLERSGLKSLTIGVESGSQKILSLINKGASTDDFFTANKILRRTNISPLYCVIQGFPCETIKDIKQTYKLIIKLIKSNNRCRVDLIKLIPTPSTKILDICVQEGFKKPATLEDWIGIIDSNHDKSIPWVDKKLEKWITKHRLFLKFLWLRNDCIPFSNFLFSIYSHLIKRRL